MTVVGSVRAATAASSLPTCSSLECSPGSSALNRTGAILSSISMATTPAASSSLTVRTTLTALPNPSSPSTIKLTSAMVHRVGHVVHDDVRDSHVRHLPHRAGQKADFVVQHVGDAR